MHRVLKRWSPWRFPNNDEALQENIIKVKHGMKNLGLGIKVKSTNGIGILEVYFHLLEALQIPCAESKEWP